jgi:hypothetical protein
VNGNAKYQDINNNIIVAELPNAVHCLLTHKKVKQLLGKWISFPF